MEHSGTQPVGGQFRDNTRGSSGSTPSISESVARGKEAIGAAATDVQTGAATMCYLPDRNSPERETWYINMGAVDREFFTTNAMVRAAQ